MNTNWAVIKLSGSWETREPMDGATETSSTTEADMVKTLVPKKLELLMGKGTYV